MKIAIVTGASRGLGRSMAEHLSRAGWGIVGTYSSSEDEVDSGRNAAKNTADYV